MGNGKKNSSNGNSTQFALHQARWRGWPAGQLDIYIYIYPPPSPWGEHGVLNIFSPSSCQVLCKIDYSARFANHRRPPVFGSWVGIPCLHSVPESYTIESRGSLGGGLGAMLGSKIGLGSSLGAVLGPSWAQEPIKTPKSEEMSLQERPRASLGPPNLEPKSNINQHKINQKIYHFLK